MDKVKLVIISQLQVRSVLFKLLTMVSTPLEEAKHLLLLASIFPFNTLKPMAYGRLTLSGPIPINPDTDGADHNNSQPSNIPYIYTS